VKPQIPGSGKCAGHAGLMGASSRMPARAALDSGIVLARDLAGCRVHEMDAPTSQASHRVMCFFVNIIGHPALNVLARDGTAIKKCRHTC
jgi:hypothetical protein